MSDSPYNYQTFKRTGIVRGGDKGAQGKVYAATVTMDLDELGLKEGDVVAVKELISQTNLRKALALTQRLIECKHVNVLPYHCYFIKKDFDAEQLCIVMPLLEGMTLKELYHSARERGEFLGFEYLKNVFEWCFDGLNYLASSGIAHRDIKPSNIFIELEENETTNLRLIDLSLAKNEENPEETKTAGVKGTMSYLAPEWVLEDDVLNHAKLKRGDEISDVFSLAVCIYEAFAGAMPYVYEGNFGFYDKWKNLNHSAVHYNVRALALERKHQHLIRQFDLLQGLEPFLQHAMHPDRKQRIQSFAEMQQLFHQIILRPEPGQTIVSDEPPPRPEPIADPNEIRITSETDEYILIKKIGSGGQATVIQGKRVSDGLVVAVKRLDGENMRERFDREAAILFATECPFLVRFYDHIRGTGLDGGRDYLVMEHLDRMPESSLYQRIKKHPEGLDPQEMLQVFIRYLIALDVLHQQKIIHRDIKPSNLYAPEGDIQAARIYDLGIARTDNSELTADALAPGTFRYMAPEFLKKRFKGSVESDLYAMGVSLFEALTGHHPFHQFDGATRSTILAFHEFAQSTKAVPNLSFPIFSQLPELAGVVNQAIHLSSGKRYRDASGFLADLLSILERYSGQVQTELRGQINRWVVDFDDEGGTMTSPIGLGVIEEKIVKSGFHTYRLREVMGEGGFGRVWEGFDDAGKTVAVKELKEGIDTKRFILEGELLGGLDCPYIVRHIEFFDYQVGFDLSHFLVLEYLPGMPKWSLRNRIKSKPSEGMNPQEVLELFIRYAVALRQLHGHPKKIIHRDIKPSNLYAPANDTREAKIFDLGVARIDESTMTGTNMLPPGTYDYMAPEFCLNIENDFKGSPGSDLYALGLSMYEALVGMPAFERLSVTTNPAGAFFKRARTQPKPSVQGAVFKQHAELRRLVEKSTHPNPDKRYKNTDDFIYDALQALGTVSNESAEALKKEIAPWMRAAPPKVSKPKKQQASDVEGVTVATSATHSTQADAGGTAKTQEGAHFVKEIRGHRRKQTMIRVSLILSLVVLVIATAYFGNAWLKGNPDNLFKEASALSITIPQEKPIAKKLKSIRALNEQIQLGKSKDRDSARWDILSGHLATQLDGLWQDISAEVDGLMSATDTQKINDGIQRLRNIQEGELHTMMPRPEAFETKLTALIERKDSLLGALNRTAYEETKQQIAVDQLPEISSDVRAYDRAYVQVNGFKERNFEGIDSAAIEKDAAAMLTKIETTFDAHLKTTFDTLLQQMKSGQSVNQLPLTQIKASAPTLTGRDDTYTEYLSILDGFADYAKLLNDLKMQLSLATQLAPENLQGLFAMYKTYTLKRRTATALGDEPELNELLDQIGTTLQNKLGTSLAQIEKQGIEAYAENNFELGDSQRQLTVQIRSAVPEATLQSKADQVFARLDSARGDGMERMRIVVAGQINELIAKAEQQYSSTNFAGGDQVTNQIAQLQQRFPQQADHSSVAKEITRLVSVRHQVKNRMTDQANMVKVRQARKQLAELVALAEKAYTSSNLFEGDTQTNAIGTVLVSYPLPEIDQSVDDALGDLLRLRKSTKVKIDQDRAARMDLLAQQRSSLQKAFSARAPSPGDAAALESLIRTALQAVNHAEESIRKDAGIVQLEQPFIQALNDQLMALANKPEPLDTRKQRLDKLQQLIVLARPLLPEEKYSALNQKLASAKATYYVRYTNKSSVPIGTLSGATIEASGLAADAELLVAYPSGASDDRSIQVSAKDPGYLDQTLNVRWVAGGGGQMDIQPFELAKVEVALEYGRGLKPPVQVSINNKTLPADNVAIRLVPGTYQIRFTRNDHQPIVLDEKIVRGSTQVSWKGPSEKDWEAQRTGALLAFLKLNQEFQASKNPEALKQLRAKLDVKGLEDAGFRKLAQDLADQVDLLMKENVLASLDEVRAVCDTYQGFFYLRNFYLTYERIPQINAMRGKQMQQVIALPDQLPADNAADVQSRIDRAQAWKTYAAAGFPAAEAIKYSTDFMGLAARYPTHAAALKADAFAVNIALGMPKGLEKTAEGLRIIAHMNYPGVDDLVWSKAQHPMTSLEKLGEAVAAGWNPDDRDAHLALACAFLALQDYFNPAIKNYGSGGLKKAQSTSAKVLADLVPLSKALTQDEAQAAWTAFTRDVLEIPEAPGWVASLLASQLPADHILHGLCSQWAQSNAASIDWPGKQSIMRVLFP